MVISPVPLIFISPCWHCALQRTVLPDALRPVTVQFGAWGTALSGLTSRMHCCVVIGGMDTPGISMREVTSHSPGCMACAKAAAGDSSARARRRLVRAVTEQHLGVEHRDEEIDLI